MRGFILPLICVSLLPTYKPAPAAASYSQFVTTDRLALNITARYMFRSEGYPRRSFGEEMTVNMHLLQSFGFTTLYCCTYFLVLSFVSWATNEYLFQLCLWAQIALRKQNHIIECELFHRKCKGIMDKKLKFHECILNSDIGLSTDQATKHWWSETLVQYSHHRWHNASPEDKLCSKQVLYDSDSQGLFLQFGILPPIKSEMTLSLYISHHCHGYKRTQCNHSESVLTMAVVASTIPLIQCMSMSSMSTHYMVVTSEIAKPRKDTPLDVWWDLRAVFSPGEKVSWQCCRSRSVPK